MIDILIVLAIMIFGYFVISGLVLLYRNSCHKEYCPKCEDKHPAIELDYDRGIYHCTNCKHNFFIH